MGVTVDDVNICDGLEYVYVKYKSHASAARELPGPGITMPPLC